MLNLCTIDFFLNRFDSISEKSKCCYLFIYIKYILNLYLANAIIAKIIVTSTIEEAKN